MRILAVNAGSSSLKCVLYDMPSRRAVLGANVERIGTGDASLTVAGEGAPSSEPCEAASHEGAFRRIAQCILGSSPNGPESAGGIAAVGHRVVHGGPMNHSSLVTAEVERVIEDHIVFAPLHNPYNLVAIRAAARVLPELPHVAVFDTAFHATLPARAYLYALPLRLNREHGIRAYGFHGISYEYVTARTAELLGRPRDQVNAIILHLGNGSSAAAVVGGRSADTSMGVTPLGGLVMGTRCGDIDPSIPFLLGRWLGMSGAEVDDVLNRESGLLGLSGVSNDMREVIEAAAAGSGDAETALEVFAYRARKYIGAYSTVTGRTDAVVFTAGIGENAPSVRRRICAGLEHMGIALDDSLNQAAVGTEAVISPPDAPVAVMVVPTHEALQIAVETYRIVNEDQPE